MYTIGEMYHLKIAKKYDLKLTIMKNQKKLLCKIAKKLNGLNKVEAYEITQKLETLLFYSESTIEISALKKIISSRVIETEEIDPFHFTILPNGNFCEFDGSNDWLHIYKENKRYIPNWSIFNTYYFKTKYAPLELLKLTKKNLLETLQRTDKGQEIQDYLRINSIIKKDIITDKLLILDL